MSRLLTAVSILALTLGANAARAEMDNSDVKFVNKAAISDMTEIASSKLALDKTSNPDIKKFAQQMIDDHTKLSSDMKALATAKGVTAPPSDKSVDKEVAKLNKLSGADFDKKYLKDAIDAHKDASKLFHKDGPKLKDPDLKAAVLKATPTIDSHLAHVKELGAANGIKS